MGSRKRRKSKRRSSEATTDIQTLLDRVCAENELLKEELLEAREHRDELANIVEAKTRRNLRSSDREMNLAPRRRSRRNIQALFNQASNENKLLREELNQVSEERERLVASVQLFTGEFPRMRSKRPSSVATTSEAKKEEVMWALPKEVVVEIMTWVPADSLMEFKRVNKSWLALITELVNDPSFVAVHLSNTKKQTSVSLLLYPCLNELDCSDTLEYCEDKFNLVTISNCDPTNDFDHIPSISKDFDLPSHFTDFCTHDWRHALHCDGLVCFLQATSNFVIFNPVLHEWRIVADLPAFDVLGFGYEPREKDYKLVTIEAHGNGDETTQYHTHVYSVNSDSWKAIQMAEGISVKTLSQRDALYWKGVCYWYTVDRVGNPVILCFDMADEEFSVVDFPGREREASEFNYWRALKLDNWGDLTVWNDSLAQCHLVYENDSETSWFLDIYVLQSNYEKNKGVSWTKHRVGGPFKSTLRNFPYIQNNEIHMCDDREKQLYSYNLHTRKLRRVSIQHSVHWQSWHIFYEKSLVSLEPDSVSSSSSSGL